jgi:WD40 repeat protein
MLISLPQAIQFNSVRLASAGQDAKIHLWDMRSLDRKLHTLSGHSLYIWDLQFDVRPNLPMVKKRTPHARE